jgi:WD40 repeat protein
VFWPGLWLPFEQDIGKARILTFGYKANFGPGSTKGIANVSDFAKELLFEMRFGKDDSGGDLGIGDVPIIFVVHSLGGLVVKKAYILGQNDDVYQSIVRSISAIMFLATPHRGTGLAEVLSRILAVSFQSPKIFIMDLNKGSPAIEEINEQFRHIAPRLFLVSFYETLATSVKLIPIKIMVLDKDSSVLGYPREISRDLAADHHDVCKYSSRDDPNYVIVRNMLQTLMRDLRSKGMNIRANQMSDELRDIEKLLGISRGPEDDFNLFRRRWMPNTCNWIINEPALKSWLESSQESKVIWFNAPPASGKSVLSAYLIEYLHMKKSCCQYFFFKFGDPSKRSLSTLLRSIAYQTARDDPSLRRSLIEISTEELRLEKADSMLIWQKVFESIIFKRDFKGPYYWIIDAVDESESPKALLDLFRSIPKSKPIRLLLVSRKTEQLSLAFDQLSDYVNVNSIEKYGHDHNSADIRTLVEAEMKHMQGTNELKEQVKENIIRRASGNFLWVRLVLEEIVSCHIEEVIQEVLEEIPNDMDDLYKRMELAILSNRHKSYKRLAISLLQWTICANRSLTMKELSQALQPEFTDFFDPRRTIQDVCGQFVVVDERGQVGMVHQTARDYLIRKSNEGLAIDLQKSHGHLFMKTISVLLDPGVRSKLTYDQHKLRSVEPFLFYAATSWMYHLKMADTSSDDYLDMLLKLFDSESVLSWIHALALIGQLEILVKAAKALGIFVSLNRKLNANKNPLLHRLSDLETLDLWMIDLVKLVGKFSRHLLFDPHAIYKLVPPFCPEKSIIHRQFYRPQSAEVTVSGVSNTTWNDNLAKITLPNAEQAWKIVCAGSCIAVLGSAGTIFIYDSSNFSQMCTLHHQEPITAVAANIKGTKLVTYGLRSTKLWSIPSGQLLQSTPNPPDCKSMTITFADDESKILTGGDDKIIRFINIDSFDAGWQVLNPALLKETSEVEGTFVNSPMWMAFNADATQIGVCYRGFPLAVWNLKESRCIGRCRRTRDLRGDHARPSTSWFAVDRFTWNPISGHIIGIYKDGCLFKWHPVTSETQEIQTQAEEVAASSDGKLFVTSNSNGTVRVWNFAFFSVIYQLSSTDLLTGLAFSPDSERFYDLRGCSVNAWEPNSLTRFSETEESFSDAASEYQSLTSISHVSEACVTEYEAVSSLALSPQSWLYCVGNEEGRVDLCNARTGEQIEFTKFHNFLGVGHLVWSDDGAFVAAADLGGDIVLKRVTIPETGDSARSIEVSSLKAPKVSLEGRAIHQMLFNHDSTLLLIITDDWGQMWDIHNAKVIINVTIERGATRQWSKHPIEKTLFLAFGCHDVKIFQWHDFVEKATLQFREDALRMHSQASFDSEDEQMVGLKRLSLKSESDQIAASAVSKTLLTQDRKHTLLQVKDTSSQGRSLKRLLVFENSKFQKHDHELTNLYIPLAINSKIDIPLGVLPGSRLVFLDPDMWVCTYKLETTHREEVIERHYFIPRDWASTESLEQCCMMEDGTFLCPKDDTVAVVRYNLEDLQSLWRLY